MASGRCRTDLQDPHQRVACRHATCGECGHTGAVTTKPGGVTGVNLLIWAACTLFSCGFLIWMPLVFKSLRTPVLHAPTAARRSR